MAQQKDLYEPTTSSFKQLTIGIITSFEDYYLRYGSNVDELPQHQLKRKEARVSNPRTQ